MKIIKESKWQKAYDLKGQIIYVKTIIERDKNGKRFSRRIAVRQKVA